MPGSFPPACSLALTLAALPLAAQEHAHTAGAPERLGRVSFPVSCRAEVRPQFERGVAMLHSFWFPEAERTFQDVAWADPACAMAHWGVAMARRGNPYAGVPSPASVPVGLAAAERGAALLASATPRERAYVEAALAFFRGYEPAQHRARMLAYEAAMRRVRDGNPQDPEAQIFYAQAVIANAPPADMTFARQKEAAAILEPLYQKSPDHPGLAHYLIHAYDAPPLAKRGLQAATRYSEIAPSAPHALHMPSHVFTRLGMWDESIRSNRRAADAEGTSPGRVHPMDYLVYAYLQQGRDALAERVARDATAPTDGGAAPPVVRYNEMAMPARLVLERARWAEAADLALPRERVAPEFEAIPRFTRAIGAARSGRTGAARAELASLTALETALRQRGDTYWTTVVGAQRLAVEAWIARAEGRGEEAVRLARRAAEQEETVEKHPVTPGPLLPCRELQGDLLLEMRRPREAQRAYEANLVREPRRARSLFGAAVAAERAGDRTAATRHFRALAELMSNADSGRAEAVTARAFLRAR